MAMNHRIFITLLFSALSVCAMAQANAPEKSLTPFEQNLMNAEKSFVDAAKKGDVNFFKRTLADDFSFVAFDGQMADRQEMIDQFASGGLDLLPYDMKVVHVSDNVGIV